jgi:intermembrane space import and assembly protein 40
MQDCFRRYPEVYGAELDDDDDDEVSDVPPPVPEAFENSSPDPTKPPPTEMVPIALEVHEKHRQPPKVAAGISETQLAPEHPENKHSINNEIKNEDTKAVTKQVMKEHATLDDDNLPESSREKKGVYKEKQ